MGEVRLRQFNTVYLASDHAGFERKEQVKSWLLDNGFLVIDGGADRYDSEDDFPDFVIPTVSVMTQAGPSAAAIIFGGSGQGEAMAANKVHGVRASVYYGLARDIVPLARTHNNSNVLSIGARFVDESEAKWAVWEFIHTPTAVEEKYHRRNRKLDF